MRPLSYSSLRTYDACPLRWKLKYVDNARPDTTDEPAPVTLGRAVHEALEAYHRGAGGVPAARRKLASAAVRDADAAAGHAMLDAFHRREAKRRARVLGVEQHFRMDVDGVPFVGTIDRIEEVPRTSRVAIVDYKSGARVPGPWVPRVSAQLGYYQMGAEEGLGYDVDHLAIEHLRTGLRFTANRRTEPEMQALRERVTRAWDAMRAGEFPARLNRDCPCEFASRCPYYRDAFPTILDWTGEVRERVATLVERYAATRDADARSGIEAHMRAHGTLRAWGHAHVVERNAVGHLRVRAREDVSAPEASTFSANAEKGRA